MFLPRRPAAGRRTGARLAILGVLGIAGLLATTDPFSLRPTWPRLVGHVLAQSDTATPTVLPQTDTPPAPPNPTAGLSEPPLTIQSSASVASAGAGEQFNFTARVAGSSVELRAVELRANIDGQLELLSASASGGSCSGGATLVCKLSVQLGQPATIVAAVRVRPNVTPDSRLVYQALAQDDLSNTAVSDQVIVTIAAPPPAAPTASPNPTPDQGIPANGGGAPARPTIPASRPARPAPTAAPASGANHVVQNPVPLPVVALPAIPTFVAAGAVIVPSAGGAAPAAPAQGVAPADSWLVTAPGASAPAQAVEPAAPALLVPVADAAPPMPEQAPRLVEQRLIVQLPNTAAAPPVAGVMASLLGLALVIHGLRRVYHAAAQLDRQSAALGRLAALLHAAARRRTRMTKDDRLTIDDRQSTIARSSIVDRRNEKATFANVD